MINLIKCQGTLFFLGKENVLLRYDWLVIMFLIWNITYKLKKWEENRTPVTNFHKASTHLTNFLKNYLTALLTVNKQQHFSRLVAAYKNLWHVGTQKLANVWLPCHIWSSPDMVFVNKVLLESGHVSQWTNSLWLLSVQRQNWVVAVETRAAEDEMLG